MWTPFKTEPELQRSHFPTTNMTNTTIIARVLTEQQKAFEQHYRAKGWPDSYFVPHSGGRIEYGRASTQDKWEGWRDRDSSLASSDTPVRSAVQGSQQKEEWHPITAPGQVSAGDKLRFTIGDEEHRETVKEVLDSGTDREEIIYNKRRNFYLITSLLKENKGCQKNVRVLRVAPAASSLACLSQSDPATPANVDKLVAPAAMRADEVDAEVVNARLNGAEGNLSAAADADPHDGPQSGVLDPNDSSTGASIQAVPSLPVVGEGLTYADGIEAAAKWLDDHRDQHAREFGETDHSTGAVTFRSMDSADYDSALADLAEGIRMDLLAAPAAAPAPQKCPRCGEPADLLFTFEGDGEELGTTHCGCLHDAPAATSPQQVAVPEGLRTALGVCDVLLHTANTPARDNVQKAREAIEAAILAAPASTRAQGAVTDERKAFAAYNPIGYAQMDGWSVWQAACAWQRSILAAPAQGAQATAELSRDEVQEFARTVAEFDDANETSTDYDTLMAWAARGLLECAYFGVTSDGRKAIDSALYREQAQEGGDRG